MIAFPLSFLTIADGHPAGFEGPDDPGQKNSRWQDIGLRAVLRRAMEAYQRQVVTVRHENATLDDLPPALRAEVEARLKREFPDA